MTTGRTKSLLAVGLVAVLTGSVLAQNQTSTARLDGIQKRLTQIAQAYDKLPPRQQALLDGYSHLIHLSRVFNQVSPKLLAARQAGKQISRREFAESIVGGDPNLVKVNDPSTDLDFSGFDGLTQSETSSAMCGNQVVVGFNDSGSELQTF